MRPLYTDTRYRRDAARSPDKSRGNAAHGRSAGRSPGGPITLLHAPDASQNDGYNRNADMLRELQQLSGRPLSYPERQIFAAGVFV